MCAGFRKQIQYRNTQNDERHTDHVHGVNFLTVDRAARNVAKDIPKPAEKVLVRRLTRSCLVIYNSELKLRNCKK